MINEGWIMVVVNYRRNEKLNRGLMNVIINR